MGVIGSNRGDLMLIMVIYKDHDGAIMIVLHAEYINLITRRLAGMIGSIFHYR